MLDSFESRVDGKTLLYGLLGYPVEHTLSPVIHNTLNRLNNRNAVYVPFLTKKEDVESAVKGAASLNIKGLNVTVPHKQAVIPFLKETDDTAKAIGAVNTLVWSEEKAGYVGYNTDAPGLLRAIKSEGIEIKDRDVVLLGAGGAARAVAYMCMCEKAKRILILNRTLEKAEEIAKEMNAFFKADRISFGTLDEYANITEKDLIVFQCTSIGLSDPEAVVLDDPAFYKQISVAVDLVYKPATTKFMRLAKESGAKTMNGLKMLLYQAVVAYELMHGLTVSEADVNEAYDRLYEEAYKTREQIVLIGYMGSGKTTIGKVLAKETGRKFVDTDALIEEKEGCSIREIFEKNGEEYFRNLETEMLLALQNETDKLIIATGGGMPVKAGNTRLLRTLGPVIYLAASKDELYNRLKSAKNRPLLDAEDLKKRIDEMLTIRGPIYRKTAHETVYTDGKTPEEIAREIGKLTACVAK